MFVGVVWGSQSVAAARVHHGRMPPVLVAATAAPHSPQGRASLSRRQVGHGHASQTEEHARVNLNLTLAWGRERANKVKSNDLLITLPPSGPRAQDLAG